MENLYRDAIQSISQLLYLKEFVSSASTCKNWQAAARSKVARNDHFNSLAIDRFQSLLSSSLRHHVTVIGPANGELLSLGFNDLLQLTNRLSHLKELYCELRFDPFKTTEQEWQFPMNLKTLVVRLNIHYDGDDVAGAAAAAMSVTKLFHSISQLQSLEELRLGFDASSRLGFPDAAAMTPLVSLPKLHTIGLIGVKWNLAPAHAAIIRRIPNLTELSPPNDWLAALTLTVLVEGEEGAAFASRIKKIGFYCDITSNYVPALAKLTAIENFHPRSILWDVDLSFLSSMTGARVLSLQIDDSNALEPLVDSLKKTSKLEDLFLNHTFLDEVHLSSFLPHLPQLHTLAIHSDVLSSLEFLATSANLAKTLRTFRLYECSNVPSAEVRFLRSLTSLEQLCIFSSFKQQLDDPTRDQHDPKSPSFLSSVWPNLRVFSFQ